MLSDRSKRYLERKHREKYGEGAGDQRGRHGQQACGKDHYRWNRGTIISSHGYVKVRVGRGNPLADPNGYAYEHLVVWTNAGHRRPLSGEVIHHINEDRTDNRLENLELLKREDHAEKHGVVRDTNGRFVRGPHA